MDFKSDRAQQAYKQLFASLGREGDELERRAQEKRKEMGEYSYLMAMIEIAKFRQSAMNEAIETAAKIELNSVALTASLVGPVTS